MSKKSLTIIFLIVLMSIASACISQPEETPEVNHEQQVTFAVETVYAQIALTEAAAAAMATPTPMPTNTPLPTETPTLVPTATPTNVFENEAEGDDEAAESADTGTSQTEAQQPQQGSQSQSEGLPCHRANLEYETIPDGTELPQERKFVKVWRIKNTGSCTWNENYILRFYSGDLLGAGAAITLTDENIPTWGFANVEVDMKAPADVGTYKGYWKIVSDSGKIFGVGADGKGWIWIEIKVVSGE
ncbi:MAG: hypothetical protein ISR58_07210 [Anaerolineales bacterium]|nr:hypothetical protein [Chloroflexota bacterium]MBL6980964.1 hypothetical protein [Anaerolineales bacterium]